MYKEEDLMKAFEKARKGSKDYYEDFCTMMFDEVRRLVCMVYEKESNINKLVNHIFNKLRPRLNEFDSSKEDIHRWVSVFASSMIYSVYNMSNSDVFTYKEENSDFEIGYIEEDDDFAECAIHFNREMSSKNFKKSDSVFSMLTKGQIILYQLFCYAGCTVEEIEDMLEVDGIYICSELYDIKQVLVKELKEDLWVNKPVADKAVSAVTTSTVVSKVKAEAYEDSDADYDEADDESDDDDSDGEVDDEAKSYDTYTTMPNRSDEETDEQDDADEETESKYAAYLNGDNKTRKATNGNVSSPRKRKKKKSGGIMGLFESVPDKMMKLIAMIIIALILIVILVMVVIFGNGKKNNTNTNNNNVNTEQQSSTQAGEQETGNQTQASGDETEGQSQSVESSEQESTVTDGNDSQTESENTQTPETQEQPTQTPGTQPEETQPTETQAPETEAPAPETDSSESQTESQTDNTSESESTEAETQPDEQATEAAPEAPSDSSEQGATDGI